MKIAVLLKQVPDLAEELEVDDSGKALDTEYIKFRLNEYDEHALEEAVCLKEAGEANEVTAIALDGEEVEKADLMLNCILEPDENGREPQSNLPSKRKHHPEMYGGGSLPMGRSAYTTTKTAKAGVSGRKQYPCTSGV